MIFVTGDTHSDVARLEPYMFPPLDTTKDDVVIIAGDFGLIWNKDKESIKETSALDMLDKRPFTTVFVDGNHENFDRLNKYPEGIWNGGKVHVIRDNVLHLMRGQVFDIPTETKTKKVFTFGGAPSYDIKDGILDPTKDAEKINDWKQNNFKARFFPDYHAEYKLFRILGESWWPEEMPNDDEYEEGIKNLDKVDWKVDYIITHDTCFDYKQILCGATANEADKLNSYLGMLHKKLDYKKWFFGHYHQDAWVSKKDRVLYYAIINAETNEEVN